MNNGAARAIRSALGWVLRRPSYMILTAGEAELASEPPRRFRNCWLGLMVLSAAWGVFQAGLWSAASSLFEGSGRAGIPLMPAAAVVAAMALGLYRQPLLSLADVLAGRRRRARGLACAAVLVLLAMAFLDLQGRRYDWGSLPSGWQWLRPPGVYRPLVLAPVWGAWAMLIVGQFSRPTRQTEPAVAAMVRGCGPVAAALCMAPPLAGSLYYFNYLSWWQPSVSAAAVLAAIVGGVVLCRLSGALTRRALLAGNLLTQIVFFLAYLANR
jgi:hypothetical protein